MAADGASNTREHIFLPPSSVRGRLGAYAADNVAPTYKFPDDAYWKNFYDAVLKNGASSPAGPAQPKLLPDASALQALHMHQYEFEYTDGVLGEGNYQGSPGWIVTPMHAVAAAAFRVIEGLTGSRRITVAPPLNYH